MGLNISIAVILVRNILVIGIIVYSITIAFSGGCSDTSTPTPEPSSYYPYLDEFPALSPDGTKIIYFHRGIAEFGENGFYRVDQDSMGLWMVNIDGSNPHIIINARDVVAQWSSDNQWITFHLNKQVYKAKLSGDYLDTLSIQRLTSSDSQNFFPSWCSVG